MIYNSSNTAKSRNRDEAAATLLSISSSSRSTEAKQQDMLTEEELAFMKHYEALRPGIDKPTIEEMTRWCQLEKKRRQGLGGKTAGEMLRDIEDAKLRRCYCDDIRRVHNYDKGQYHYSKRINEILNKVDDSNLTETEKLIRKKAMIFGSVVLLYLPQLSMKMSVNHRRYMPI